LKRWSLSVVAEQPPEELTPEELLEQIRRMKVSDLLLSTLGTVAQLGYAKLDPAGRDLEQARLAVEALRALLPVVEGSVPEEVVRDFQSVTANLQLAYAKAVKEPSGEGEPAA
jgi:hypothetical protein